MADTDTKQSSPPSANNNMKFPAVPRGDSSISVFVTGASGFIGGHIILMLLEETDYLVRGSVRSTKGDTVKHLKEWIANPKYHIKDGSNRPRLSIIDGCDLLKPGSFDAGVKGSTFVIHTASGVALTASDKKASIIDPAIQGTKNVLEACKNSGGSVKTLVMTSSVAAIGGDHDSGKTLTESDWNTTCKIDHDEYGYSKVESEKECWRFVDSLLPDQKFKVVSINPTFVTGPLLTAHLNNIGLVLIHRLMARKLPAVPRFNWGVVDVRDVARAHLLVMDNPKAQGRYIIMNRAMWLQQVGQELDSLFPNYNPPTSVMPDWLMYTLAYSGLEKQVDAEALKVRLGRAIIYSTKKMESDLGMIPDKTMISVRESLRDSGQSLVDAGLVKPGKSLSWKLAAAGAVTAVVGAAAYWWWSTAGTSKSGGSGGASAAASK